ncbi:MAG: ATP-binding cassette domain-containing protein, partial [Proteobacteria bacterium]|nr:ATP-binding cassette domain-containing protein [Pseudomonadota bacterium]
SFAVHAGQAVAIIGPTGSGKTSLLRALVGIWTPVTGKIMLDGAGLDQWDLAARGRHFGFLPQDIQLLDGTIAENIARFEEGETTAAVLEAAKAAGLHDSIVALKDGYGTRIGRDGIELSAGQRQRLGLARALYRDPFVVALDEPNSNLDAEGEQAVAEAIRRIRARGGIALVIAHRPSVVAAVDLVLAMRAGSIVAFGPRDEVLANVLNNARNVVQHPSARTDGLRGRQSLAPLPAAE